MSATATARAAWTVRPARNDDVESVVALLEATFDKPASEAAYRWKFLESPWPVSAPTAFVATYEGRVVAHYGGTPMGFRVVGRSVAALHACDVMVAPAFRRQGVITAVAEAAHGAWAAAGAEIVLGLPPPGLAERLGFRPTVRLGWLWRPLRPAALRRRAAGPRVPGTVALDRLVARGWERAWSAVLGRAGLSVDVRPVTRPGGEFDVLWEELAARYGALVVRDRAWLAYRYAASPSAYRILVGRVAGRPAGYLVYRLRGDGDRRHGWVADLFTAPGDRAARAALLRTAFAELLRAGAVDVRMFAVHDAPLSRELSRVGFVRRRGAFDVGVVPLAPGLPWDVLRDPSRCLLTGGDFDVV